MFLIRPNPYKDESLTGYVVRTNFMNGYPDKNYLLKMIHGNSREFQRNIYHEMSIDRISKLSGIGPETLYQMTDNSFKERMDESTFNKLVLRNCIQFCPMCFKLDTIYHQKVWNLSVINVCLEHRVNLIKTCPICSNSISLVSYIKGECSHCRNPFLKEETEKQYEESRNFANHRMLANLFIDFKTIELFGKRLEMDRFMTLSQYSLFLLQGSNGVMRNTRHSSGLESQKQNLGHWLSKVIDMYKDFPTNFVSALNRFDHIADPTRKTIVKTKFEKMLQDDFYQNIRSEFVNYWAQKQAYRKTTALKLGQDISSKNISKFKASIVMGLNITTVNQMVRIGLLNEVSYQYKKWLIIDEVNELIKRCHGEISSKKLFDRISIREAIEMKGKNGITVLGYILLILNQVLTPISPIGATSILDVTLDKSELETVLSYFGKLGESLQSQDDVSHGIATITREGVNYEGKTFVSPKLAAMKCFDHAEIHGEWSIPIQYSLTEPNQILLYHMHGLEAAVAKEDTD
ncbi:MULTISPECIES: TniQ family protein [Paenibacillus]|uniref:TniQ family protein n=1 Tax=Paenibacillus TaxID=44249 RepID=UPI0011A9FF9C|nr:MULTISPECIES: TniQ family protein [Paenibacillus]MBJ9989259.1 TniQ family protein [Paenibacillus sp. S28]